MEERFEIGLKILDTVAYKYNFNDYLGEVIEVFPHKIRVRYSSGKERSCFPFNIVPITYEQYLKELYNPKAAREKQIIELKQEIFRETDPRKYSLVVSLLREKGISSEELVKLMKKKEQFKNG